MSLHTHDPQQATLIAGPGAGDRRRLRTRWTGLASLLLAVCLAAPISNLASIHLIARASSSSQLLYTSIDTMKESMDTDTYQLTAAQIADDVNLAASLNPSYITVDTYMNYPAYMAEWVNAVRAAGKHVWFRIHWNAWEGDNGASASMTPSQYLSSLSTFISQNPSLFKSGDILDGCPEPENSPYWANTYGLNWTYSPAPPNAGTDAFNSFLTGLTNTENSALQAAGISSVITTVHSTSEWYAKNPALYASTVSAMGNMVTIDSYPDQNTTDPTTATNDWLSVLSQIESYRPGVRILIAEMGYSNAINVDDATQQSVLQAEFAGLATVPYIIGMNYWVGAGTSTSGGYTHIFAGSTGAWTLRPAGYTVQSFYKTYGSGGSPTQTSTPTPTNTTSPVPPTATATNTPVPPTATATKPPVPPTATATMTPVPPTATVTVAPSCPSGWSCADIGTTGAAGSESLSNGTWTVQGSGYDIWLTADAFHYDWQTLSGDGRASAHVTSQTNTNAWAKAGVMLRLTTDPGSPFYDVVVTPSNGIVVQYRASQGANAAQVAQFAGTVPIYLEATRSGTTYSAYTSSDGVNWTLIPGSTVTLSGLSGTLLAGLAVTSHNTGVLSTVTFDTVTIAAATATATPTSTPVQPAWSSADIGNVGATGSYSVTGGTWTVAGSGADIFGTADAFHFVWQGLSGDGAISAHVLSQTYQTPWAKAGVMLRGSTSASAPFYAALITPGYGYFIEYRSTQGGSGVRGTLVSGKVPEYLRITRAGSTFSAYGSSDGITWTLIPNSTTTLSLPSTLLRGLAVTSHNSGALSTVTYSDIAS